MARSADDIFHEILALSQRIDALDAESAARKRLEHTRDGLRREAALIAVGGRHPRSVELQIETIEQRLEEISQMQIKEGYQERRGGRNIQDPGAYSVSINRLLADQHAEEVESLTRQLELLRSGENGSGPDPSP